MDPDAWIICFYTKGGHRIGTLRVHIERAVYTDMREIDLLISRLIVSDQTWG